MNDEWQWQYFQENAGAKKDIQRSLRTSISEGKPVKEIIVEMRESVKKNGLQVIKISPPFDLCLGSWGCIYGSAIMTSNDLFRKLRLFLWSGLLLWPLMTSVYEAEAVSMIWSAIMTSNDLCLGSWGCIYELVCYYDL